jgi:hypothetical protein
VFAKPFLKKSLVIFTNGFDSGARQLRENDYPYDFAITNRRRSARRRIIRFPRVFRERGNGVSDGSILM